MLVENATMPANSWLKLRAFENITTVKFFLPPYPPCHARKTDRQSAQRGWKGVTQRGKTGRDWELLGEAKEVLLKRALL